MNTTRKLIFTTIALASAAAHASPIGGDVKVGACFYRLEDSGMVNIWSPMLRIDDGNIGGILGGSFRCVALAPGAHVAQIHSDDPYSADGRFPNAWRSKRLRIQVPDDSRIFIRIWPGSSGVGYTGPWRLEVSGKEPTADNFPVTNSVPDKSQVNL